VTRRNIAVFFDGTGQNRSKLPEANWSNVALLHDAVVAAEGDRVAQSRKYIDGVGTRSGEAMTGGGFGIGLDERIEEAYEFLWQKVNNAKEDGEEPHLYLFGFSRGAYAARWLASLIWFSGIPKDDAPRREMFTNHRRQKAKAAEQLREKGVVWDDVPVDFLGVWDTVEASVDPSFDIVETPPFVKSAYHALAMDEWRYTFKPTRFKPTDRVKEVWFPGCHTDVGGGYVERALSNKSLWWMVIGAQEADLLVDSELLLQTLDRRSAEVKYHDELLGGEGSELWKGLNLAAGYAGRYFRTIRPEDILHPSVNEYAYAAPSERPTIPATCVVTEDSSEGRGRFRRVS